MPRDPDIIEKGGKAPAGAPVPLPKSQSTPPVPPNRRPLGEVLIEMFGIEAAQRRMVWFCACVLGPGNVCGPEYIDAALKQVGL